MIDKNQIKQLQKSKEPLKFVVPHHSGKGTRARLETAARKQFFGRTYST